MQVKKSAEKIERLYNFIVVKEYGDVILHREIEEIIGLSHELKQYSIYVKNAKDKLIKKSKVLKAIPGIGYQILKPNQVSGFTYRAYIHKALKSYDYSEFILENLNTKNLSEDRLQEFHDVQELNNKIKELSNRTIKESGYYSRKDYYDSLKEDQ
jgi:hypothetical protein